MSRELEKLTRRLDELESESASINARLTEQTALCEQRDANHDQRIANLENGSENVNARLDNQRDVAQQNKDMLDSVITTVNFNAQHAIGVLKEQHAISRIRDRRFMMERLDVLKNVKPIPPRSVKATKSVDTFDEDMAWLEKLAPEAFRVWSELLDINAEEYVGYPTDSCSVVGHEVAGLFGDFTKPYMAGNVLDVGCGPQPTPVYLDGYDNQLIYGIDPLPEDEPHSFAFHRGIAERLPYKDNVFDVVLAATSLDHVLLLDKVLEEIVRVLKTSGWFVTWVFFEEGAEEYRPYRKDIQPVDKFHLFHFGKDWFEKITGTYFSLGESVDVTPTSGYQGSFYAYQVKK